MKVAVGCGQLVLGQMHRGHGPPAHVKMSDRGSADRITGIRHQRQVVRTPRVSAIRTKAKAPTTSLASTQKATDAKGQASLIIPDDENAGAAAVVVLLDPTGNVLNKKATTIGGG